MQGEMVSINESVYCHYFSEAVELQQALCHQRVLVVSENLQKLKFRQSIEDWLKHYFTSITNIIKQSTNNPKIRISEDDVFGNTYNFVKEVMLLLSKDYNLLLHLLQTQPDSSPLIQLFPSIVNLLYQNSVQDNFVNKDIVKLITKISLKSYTNKLNMLQSFLVREFFSRPECKRYGQVVSRSILLMLSPSNFPQKKLEHIEQYIRESFPKLNAAKNLSSLSNNDPFNSQDLAKQYLRIILSSQYHVPVSVRILLKSIENERGEIEKEEVVRLCWELLFGMYENSLKLPNEYLSKLHACDTNALEKTLLMNEQLKSLKTSFSKFKSYHQLEQTHKTEITQFINQLLTLPQNILKEFQSPSSSELKLYSVCFSVEEIIILLKCLHETQGLKELNQKIATRVSRIREMSEQFSDFCKDSPHYEVYCIFYEVVLPKEIDVDYMKRYEQKYANNKLLSLLRQILTTIQPLQVYLLSFKAETFIDMLKRIQEQPEEDESKNPDKVAFYVNIKYFLWMVQDKSIDTEIQEMLQETRQNHTEWLDLFSATKICFTNALYSLKGYNERATQIDNKCKQTNLMLSIQQYLRNFSFNLCVSSPNSRQKQFQTTGKLLIVNHERILLEKWENCVHHKMKLKGELDKMLHVKSFDEMIQAFCHLEEVKNSIENGVDKVGINMNFFWFLSHIFEEAAVQNTFKKTSKQFKDYLEIIATKKVYNLIFPQSATVKDRDIHNKLHYFRLLEPKHLGLELKEIKPVWELANKYLSDMNRATSTIKKFQFLKEFMKVINGILLANQSASKQKLQLVVLYALLKSDQKQIASNIHFMQIFTDPARMVSAQGAFVANIKASLRELQQLTFSKLKDIDQVAYNKQFQKLQKQMQLRQKSQSLEFIKQ